MDAEKLELINLLSQYDSEEIQQIMIIMTYWEDMVNAGILSPNDIDNIKDLSIDKQNKIKEFVSSKLQERKDNGKREQ